jgi:hypothetical protein
LNQSKPVKKKEKNPMRSDIDWDKMFVITSICRSDLLSADFTQEQIALLTDEDLLRIASKMEDWYCDGGFWEHLRDATEQVLEKKES